MIDEDIRFFKQHFPNIALQQASFRKTLNSGEEYSAVEGPGTHFINTEVEGGTQYRYIPTDFRGVGSRIGTQLSGIMSGMRLGGLADLRGGLQKIKSKESDILEELKLEHENIRKISVAQSGRSSRVSEDESSVRESKVSSAQEDSKYIQRESAVSANLQRRLENELSAKMKRIEELMLSERELQQTVTQLKSELERRQDEAPGKAKQIEAEVAHKFEKEVDYYKQETERFIAENTQLKKDLVTKTFEVEELRRTADYAEQQLRYREEDFRKSIKTLEETMSSKESHYKRIISELEYDFQDRSGTVVSSKTYRDYHSFRREELLRLEAASKWARHDYADDNSEAGMFRRLLEEESVRFKERLQEIEKTLKSKGSEIERLEKTISHHRQREDELEKQITTKDSSVKRVAESELQGKLAEREESFSRKLQQKEEAWSRRLQEKEELWTKRNSEALEHEKKTNFEQFQKTLNEIMTLNRHKEAELETLRAYKESFQRSDNETIRRLTAELEQYKDELGKQREEPDLRQELRSYKAKNDMLQKELDQFKYYMDEQQYNVKAYETEKIKGQMALLEGENKQLQATLTDNSKYIAELEAALKPLQPKRPNIMQQSEVQSWKTREDEYIAKVTHLELQYDQLNSELLRYKNNDRATIQIYEEKINEMQAEWGRRQNDLEETIQQLRGRLEDATRNRSSADHHYQLEIESLKKFIVDAVENPALQLKHKENEFAREIEKLTLLNSKNEESVRQKFKVEIEALTAIQRRMEGERAVLQNQLAEARVGEQALGEVVARLERELARKEEILRGDRAALDSEIARLTHEYETWKRKYELEVTRLTRSSEQMTRALNDKYERDMAALKIINQRLMQQSADMLQLQNQNQQLVVANRHLQAEVKEKSQAVDHLWSVKQAEYENIGLQLRRVKAIQPF